MTKTKTFKSRILAISGFTLGIGALVGCAALSTGTAQPPKEVQATPISVSTNNDSFGKVVETFTQSGAFTGALLVSKNGRVLLSKGVGLADSESKTPNTSETRFPIGSVTKRFTAVAVLRLVDSGKLRLEDSLGKFIPALPEWARSIRIENLLSHKSGLPDYTELGDVESHLASTEGLPLLVKALTEHGKHFESGAKFEYSNTNYALLGQIVEKVSGKRFDEYLRETLKSAGIADTGVFRRDAPPSNLATGTRSSPKGKVREFPPSKLEDLSGLPGDGGLYSTVGDLERLVTALAKPGLLSKTSRDKLSSGKGIGYQFGADVSEDEGESEIVLSGEIRGFASYVLQRPQDGIFVIVLSNRENAPVSDIAHALAEAAWDSSPPRSL